MIVVQIVDKLGIEYAQSCKTQAQAELLAELARENNCKVKIMPHGGTRTILEKGK